MFVVKDKDTAKGIPPFAFSFGKEDAYAKDEREPHAGFLENGCCIFNGCQPFC